MKNFRRLASLSLSILIAQPGAAMVARAPGVKPVAIAAAPSLSIGGAISASVLPAAAPSLSNPAALSALAVELSIQETGERASAVQQLQGVDQAWSKGAVEDEDGAAAAESAPAPVAARGPGRRSDLAKAKPSAPASQARIGAFSFDLDGNVFGAGFPTEIIVFKKGGSAELGVTAFDFAVVEHKIGSDFLYKGANLKDYELRAESFRNFRGDNFEKDIQKALAQPKNTWQGPSWDMFVRAMADAELAAQTYVITARGHAPEDILKGLELLQRAGYLKHLPRVENLHGVGGFKNTAAKKVEVMAKILDAIQATPVGERANKILDSDGRVKVAMHSAGFSDDTWANYAAMRDGLATLIQADPKRWNKVKVALYFTGTNDVAHLPEAMVLTSKGVVRRFTIDERGEVFTRSQDPNAPTRKSAPMPTAEVARSPMASVTEAIKKMFVSHSWGSKHAGVVEGDDLIARERNAIADFIKDKSLPNERKHVILTRYSVDDLALAKVLIAAKDAGVRVDMVTDFNTSFEYKLEDGQNLETDFSKGKPSKSGPGIFIQALLDGGFEIVSNGSKIQPRAALYSQPLYNKGDASIDPIMHEKSLLLVELPEKAGGQRKVRSYYFGTTNLATTSPRYNRTFLIQEPLSMAYGLDHADKIMQAFRESKTIEGVESEAPFRALFEDDSFMEAAYTNGKYNPNDRIIDLFERAVKGDVEIESVHFSHFVMTNGFVLEALKKAMEAQQNFRVTAVFDDKFVPTHGFGKSAIMAGFRTAPKFGRSTKGWPYELTKRVAALVWLKGVEGKLEVDPEGVPHARELWHDKTTVVTVTEEGKRWTYVFTGSLNNSTHIDNAELQFMFRLPADSTWAKAVVESIVDVARADKESAVWLDRAVVRDALSNVVGASPLYMTRTVLDNVLAAIKNELPAAGLMKALEPFVASAAKILGKQFDKDASDEKQARLQGFLEWYAALRTAGRLQSGINSKDMVNVANLAAAPGMDGYTAKGLLSSLLWDQGADEAEMTKRIQEAWKVLGLKAKIPEFKPRPAA